MYGRIEAVERRPGQSPIDPRILFALWLYGTLRGVGSARELARRCDPQTGEVAFQWICGGVSVNYHTLADFRTEHLELLDQTLTNSVAVLRNEGLVTLDPVAQDGMKVRASAGAASFRRRKLEEVEGKKKPSEQEKTRASSTDAEVRTMKMGDGGFRPAYNVQLATDTQWTTSSRSARLRDERYILNASW